MASISHHRMGMTERIGDAELAYDALVRLKRAGSLTCSYQWSGRIERVANVGFRYRGSRLAEVGDMAPSYSPYSRMR
jgi:hypothetical protein